MEDHAFGCFTAFRKRLTRGPELLFLVTLCHLRQHVGERRGEDDSPNEAGEAGHDEAAPGTPRQVDIRTWSSSFNRWLHFWPQSLEKTNNKKQ